MNQFFIRMDGQERKEQRRRRRSLAASNLMFIPLLNTMKVFAAVQHLALFRSLKMMRPFCGTVRSFVNENTTSTPPFVAPTIAEDRKLPLLLPPLSESSRRIYLLRHGETDWNAQGRIQGGGFDIPLNENGRAQARAVGSALDDIPLTVIASSDLRRARETADIVWKQHNSCNRVIDSGFREMSFGEFEGLESHKLDLDPQVKARFKRISEEIKEDSSKAYPGGGESTAQVKSRAIKAVNDLLKQYPNEKHLAIVSHGRTNKVIIAAMMDSKEINKIRQSNTCINVIDVDDEGKFTIRILNYIDHVKDNVIER